MADSKYKLTATGLGREADYYQLLAYCSALDLDEGLLVYCRVDGEAPPQQIVVRGARPFRLTTAMVQLRGSPAEVDAELAAVADLVADRVAVTPAVN